MAEVTPANPLRFVVLEITNRCNLRCAHCASDSGLPRENELTLTEWGQVLAEIHALGMRLVLISNGLPLRDEGTLTRVKELRPFLVGISVDGATPESYRRSRGVDGFDPAQALLHRLVADGPTNVIGYFPLDPALRFLHPHWDGCIAGRRLIGVRSDGDVLGCLSLGDSFVEANLRKESLREIWGSETSFARLRKKEKALTGACAKCAYAMECRAGCI